MKSPKKNQPEKKAFADGPHPEDGLHLGFGKPTGQRRRGKRNNGRGIIFIIICYCCCCCISFIFMMSTILLM